MVTGVAVECPPRSNSRQLAVLAVASFPQAQQVCLEAAVKLLKPSPKKEAGHRLLPSSAAGVCCLEEDRVLEMCKVILLV